MCDRFETQLRGADCRGTARSIKPYTDRRTRPLSVAAHSVVHLVVDVAEAAENDRLRCKSALREWSQGVRGDGNVR